MDTSTAGDEPGAWDLPAGAEVIDTGAAAPTVLAVPSTDGVERQGGGGGGRRLLALGVSAALVVGIGVGGAYAAQQLSGGGDQPADRVPADAFAYLSVDLDPPAAQKVQALRFLRSAPEIGARIGQGDDLRRAIFDAVSDALPGELDLDWERDVEPWLGDRVAVAALPPDGAPDSAGAAFPEPGILVVLQVRDEAAARTALERYQASGPDSPGLVVADGWAVIAETDQAAQDAVRRAAQASLADDAEFGADQSALGERGISTSWVDLEAVSDLVPTDLRPQLESSLVGRVAATVRFEGAALELYARGTGMTQTPGLATDGSVDLGSLPGSTAAAVGIVNGGAQVEQAWEAESGSLLGGPLGALGGFGGLGGLGGLRGSGGSGDPRSDGAGLDLPGDLVALLGEEFLLAVDTAGLAGDEPAVGARIRTEDADRAEAALGRLATLVPELADLTVERTGDGLAVSSTPEHAVALTQDGSLRESERYGDVLGDMEDADAAFYLDLGAIGDALDEPELTVWGGVGGWMTSDGDGALEITVRLATR